MGFATFLGGLFAGNQQQTANSQGQQVGGGTSQIPIFGQATGASDRMQAKFEAGSTERDAMIRNALAAAPLANLNFAALGAETGSPGAPTNGGVNIGQKSGEGANVAGFLKGLFDTENDTAIPEEDEARLEKETRASVRQTQRVENQVDPQGSVDFYAELQKLFTGPE